MKETLLRLWSDDDGQDLAEYALAVALISIAAVAIMTTVGTDASTLFSEAASSF